MDKWSTWKKSATNNSAEQINCMELPKKRNVHVLERTVRLFCSHFILPQRDNAYPLCILRLNWTARLLLAFSECAYLSFEP